MYVLSFERIVKVLEINDQIITNYFILSLITFYKLFKKKIMKTTTPSVP